MVAAILPASAAGGDTLISVAARHGVSLSELIAANPQVLDPNMVFAGDFIAVVPVLRRSIVPKPCTSSIRKSLHLGARKQCPATILQTDSNRTHIDLQVCRPDNLSAEDHTFWDSRSVCCTVAPCCQKLSTRSESVAWVTANRLHLHSHISKEYVEFK